MSNSDFLMNIFKKDHKSLRKNKCGLPAYSCLVWSAWSNGFRGDSGTRELVRLGDQLDEYVNHLKPAKACKLILLLLRCPSLCP